MTDATIPRSLRINNKRSGKKIRNKTEKGPRGKYYVLKCSLSSGKIHTGHATIPSATWWPGTEDARWAMIHPWMGCLRHAAENAAIQHGVHRPTDLRQHRALKRWQMGQRDQDRQYTCDPPTTAGNSGSSGARRAGVPGASFVNCARRARPSSTNGQVELLLAVRQEVIQKEMPAGSSNHPLRKSC
jgi:hypothetical protein